MAIIRFWAKIIMFKNEFAVCNIAVGRILPDFLCAGLFYFIFFGRFVFPFNFQSIFSWRQRPNRGGYPLNAYSGCSNLCCTSNPISYWDIWIAHIKDNMSSFKSFTTKYTFRFCPLLFYFIKQTVNFVGFDCKKNRGMLLRWRSGCQVVPLNVNVCSSECIRMREIYEL